MMIPQPYGSCTAIRNGGTPVIRVRLKPVASLSHTLAENTVQHLPDGRGGSFYRNSCTASFWITVPEPPLTASSMNRFPHCVHRDTCQRLPARKRNTPTVTLNRKNIARNRNAKIGRNFLRLSGRPGRGPEAAGITRKSE